jgi:hypothetical protein
MQDGDAAGAALVTTAAADATVMAGGAILACIFFHRRVIDGVMHAGRMRMFASRGGSQNARKRYHSQQENQEQG